MNNPPPQCIFCQAKALSWYMPLCRTCRDEITRTNGSIVIAAGVVSEEEE